MRRIARWVTVLLLIAICGPLALQLTRHVQATIQHWRDAPGIQGTTTSQTYVIPSEGWLRFRANPEARVVRVLTTPTLVKPIPELDQSVARPGWRYAMEYRVLDARGKVIETDQFHFRTQVNLYEHLLRGGLTTANLWSAQDLVPAESRQMRIPLWSLGSPAHELQLRIVSKDPEISDVAVRVAQFEERDDYDDPDLWRRLSSDRVAEICEASVYPAELIEPDFRQEILHWRWRPMSPIGVESRDYERRLLYSMDSQIVRVVKPEFSSLPTIRTGLHFVVRVPNQEGSLRLEFKRADLEGGGIPVAGSWYPDDRSDARRFLWHFSTNEVNRVVQLDVRGGKIEVTSDSAVMVNAIWQDVDGVESPLHPPSSLIRAYACDTAEVSYRLRHMDGNRTPIRVQFRKLLDPNAPARTQPVDWSLLDQQGDELASGRLDLPFEASRYDRVEVNAGTQYVSDPVTRYWETSEDAHSLRLSTPEDRVWVSVSNRPTHESRMVDVLASTVSSINAPDPRRTWYVMRPRQHHALVKAQETLVVQIGTRPPRRDEDVMQDRYRWESFLPRPTLPGRYLMLANGVNQRVRSEAVTSTYFEIPTNQTVPLNVPAEPLSRHPEVSLTYLSEAPRPRLQVVLDDQPTPLRATGAGSYPLGRLLAGEHTIRVEASADTRVFLSHIQPAAPHLQASYLKRFAARAQRNQVEFEIHKGTPDKELLTLEYYSTRRDHEPVTLEVTVRPSRVMEPNIPLSEWSCLHTTFLIHSEQRSEPTGFVLGDRGTTHQVWSRQQCYISLGENVPAGTIQVRVEGVDHQDDYFVLYRVTPGDYAEATWSTHHTSMENDE